MVIFHSYVSLPEGIPYFDILTMAHMSNREYDGSRDGLVDIDRSIL